MCSQLGYMAAYADSGLTQFISITVYFQNASQGPGCTGLIDILGPFKGHGECGGY